jgi:hypothetical protein
MGALKVTCQQLPSARFPVTGKTVELTLEQPLKDGAAWDIDVLLKAVDGCLIAGLAQQMQGDGLGIDPDDLYGAKVVSALGASRAVDLDVQVIE